MLNFEFLLVSRSLIKYIFVSVICLLPSSCSSPEYSPWAKNVKYKDLTAKNLAKLSNQNTENGDFKVAFIADPQAVFGNLRKIVDITNIRSDIDFLAVAGDITDVGLKVEWELVGDILEKSNKPYLTVVGNHDGLSKGKEIYQKMFGRFNYTLEYKGIKFIFWNNNLYEWGVPEFEWLKREVSSHPNSYVITHQPPDSGTLSVEQEDMWLEIRKLENYKMTIAGHLHKFNYKVEPETDKPVFIIERADDTNYGIVEFIDKIPYAYTCNSQCDRVE